MDTPDLPLLSRTPDAWAAQVLADPIALLNDHAHLEKKAAVNALEMIGRWPDPTPPVDWVRKMSAIARDEVEHLGLVVKLIQRAGGDFRKHHRNRYANDLRKLVRRGEGLLDTMDRLMVAALIEARSCERFEVLMRCSADPQIAKIYRGLQASELGHFHVFRDLALELGPRRPAEERWAALLEHEAAIIARQPAGPQILGGVAP